MSATRGVLFIPQPESAKNLPSTNSLSPASAERRRVVWIDADKFCCGGTPGACTRRISQNGSRPEVG